MNLRKHFSARRIILLDFLLAVLAFMLIPHLGEWYARNIYPFPAYVFSLVASIVPFSLTEWIVVLAAVLFLALPFYNIHKGKRSLRHIAALQIELLLWMYVWFYIGWGINYSRDSFYSRADVVPANMDKSEFRSFLRTYTSQLNSTYVCFDDIDSDYVISQVKQIYCVVPDNYGLLKPADYQKPKRVSFNWLYSSVGVLGFMGPFACEGHLNSKLFPVQYPFVYAHELAHLLSVTSEAEANFWAYRVCIKSSDRRIRYSGYFGILPNVMRNARSLLSESEYNSWLKTVDSRILRQRVELQDFWSSQHSPLIAEVQDALFNALLKGNGISDGTKNYDQVLRMLISAEHSRYSF